VAATIGRYEILRTVGRDDEGTIYAARDPDADRLVALEVLRAKLEDDRSRESFLRKARAVARLRHRNIIEYLDAGEHEGHPFTVTEYLSGESLSALLRRSPLPPLVERLSLMEQTCAGLAHAHAAGVVHGDIKPGALFIGADGVLRIRGFRVARLESVTTADGVFVGTLNYTAPERLTGDATDRRADVFSAGAVLYETIAGAQAFPGDLGSGVLNRILHEPPVPLVRHVPGVDPGLVTIVDRALERDPERRYHDADEMRRDIERVRLRLEDEEAPADPTLFGRPSDLSRPPSSADITDQAVKLDEVQFTVYRPKAVRPRTPYPMLVFTHLGDPPDPRPGAPTPTEKVRERAAQKLGLLAALFRDTTTDAKHGVPAEGEITLIPDIPGIDFTPERQTFRWTMEVHEHSFELDARSELDGRIARGRLAAYLGVLLLAEVDLAIRVDAAVPAQDQPADPVTARAYRKIFASYSRRDLEVVRQFERYAEALGDSYLRDLRSLRAGENWQDGLRRLIDEADVFQLFWSWNAMRSSNVRREWEYALSLNRPQFIRPTYWESPLPESSAEGLPPAALRKLHFHRLAVTPISAPPAASNRRDDDTATAPRRSAPAASAPPSRAPRRRRLAYVTSVASLLLLIAAGTMVWRGSGTPADPPPNTTPTIAQDRTAIEQLLGQYVDAYERMDQERIRAIDPAFPGIPSRPLLTSLDLALSEAVIDIAPDGQSATVRARQQFTYESNQPGVPRSSTSELYWKLRKEGSAWRVAP
jgi:serine/threonine protein kinase